MSPGRAFRDRFYHVVASVYLYNEFTGWQGLERLLDAVKTKMPGEHEFIAVIAKHAADERKHYFLFRKYFQKEGRMPLRVDLVAMDVGGDGRPSLRHHRGIGL